MIQIIHPLVIHSFFFFSHPPSFSSHPFLRSRNISLLWIDLTQMHSRRYGLFLTTPRREHAKTFTRAIEWSHGSLAATWIRGVPFPLVLTLFGRMGLILKQGAGCHGNHRMRQARLFKGIHRYCMCSRQLHTGLWETKEYTVCETTVWPVYKFHCIE